MPIAAPTVPTPSLAGRIAHGVALACVLAVGLSHAVARDVIERSPYGAVVEQVFEQLYADQVPCAVALDPDTRCFVIAPATVATIAESLESLVDGFGGALTRSEWRSANGVYHVELMLTDGLWGVLELWLTEVDVGTVHGRVLAVPRSRNGTP